MLRCHEAIVINLDSQAHISRWRLSSASVVQLDNYLVKAQTHSPSKFVRKPRGTSNIDIWKVVEYRQFLLYLGSVYMKKVLTTTLYRHFLLLSLGIRILLSEVFCSSKHDVATNPLIDFVKCMRQHYGSDSHVYNFHSLVHLSRDVLRLGSLDSFSASIFESYLGSLKRLIQKGSNPLQQVCKRIIELRQRPVQISRKKILNIFK